MSKKTSKKIKDTIKKNTKEWKLKMANAICDTIVNTVEEITFDLKEIYRQCIEQYYLYKTTSYYRHVVGKGTGTGVNLYLSDNIHIVYKSFGGRRIPSKLRFSINSDGMEGYRRYNSGGVKKEVDKEAVLDYVLAGHRGVDSDDGRFGNTSSDWYAHNVVSDYFGILSGAPNEIFDQCFDSFDDILLERTQINLEKAKKKYKL